MISLPSSKITFRRLIQALEARARHTVDVFQTPVVDTDNEQSEGQQTTAMEDTAEGTQSQQTDTQNQKETISTVETCGGRPTKRIRVVFGEPHQQPRSKPLFQLAVTDEDGNYVLIGGKEKRLAMVDDDVPLTLDQGSCIAVDWINKKGKQCDHLVVLTKDEIEYVEEASPEGGRAASGEYL